MEDAGEDAMLVEARAEQCNAEVPKGMQFRHGYQEASIYPKPESEIRIEIKSVIVSH